MPKKRVQKDELLFEGLRLYCALGEVVLAWEVYVMVVLLNLVAGVCQIRHRDLGCWLAEAR